MPIKEKQYSFEITSLGEYGSMDNRLLGSDLILILLSISEIRGNTRMQKQVFLAWKELFQNITFDPVFFPWRYGAYSKLIEDTLRILESQKYIKIRRRKGEGSIFSITSSGQKKITEKMRKLKIDTQLLQQKKIDWDEWSHKGILRYVYRKYPEYTLKTEVPYLKW
jgi:uncharacterized protein YwgA